jgi:cytochrome b
LRIILVWRWPVRLMHWCLVAAFIVAMWTRDSELDRMIHIYAGYAMAAVLIARIIYGFTANDLAAFRRFPPSLIKGTKYAIALLRGDARNYLGHNPAGALAIYGMLLLGLAVAGSGYWAFEYDSDLAQTCHHYLSYTLFWLVCLHLFGVLMGSLAHEEFLVKAMITGYKTRRSYDETFSIQAALVTLVMLLIRILDLINRLFGGKGLIGRK